MILIEFTTESGDYFYEEFRSMSQVKSAKPVTGGFDYYINGNSVEKDEFIRIRDVVRKRYERIENPPIVLNVSPPMNHP
jgi:hypothetical protein